MTPDQRIQALEDRVTVLEDALGIHPDFPPSWLLSPMQRRMLGVLMRRTAVNEEQLVAALYADEPPAWSGHKVYIHKLRKKLAPFGVEIKSWWGSGWWIPEASKAILRAQMTGMV